MFNINHRIDSIKSSLIGLVLVLASTILGLIWISVGLYNFLSEKLGSLWGPVALGGLLFVPLLVYGVVKAMAPRDRRSKQQRMFDEAFASSSVGSISRMIETMTPHSPFLAAGVAAVAGFVATRFPQFMSMFAELVTALGDELSRRKTQKSEDRARATAEMERRGAPQPPPDVEPVAKRRKAKADIY